MLDEYKVTVETSTGRVRDLFVEAESHKEAERKAEECIYGCTAIYTTNLSEHPHLA